MSGVIDRLNRALSDRYRIERELGRGGMATVYLTEDLRHERLVALKVLRPELSAVVGAERFLAEIKTTANLQHPHILPLYDSGESEGLLFYVMPYVEGESLRDRLDRGNQLPVDEAVRLTRELADALDYAHRQGVVHRDIKPANILLHDGNPLLADFGIALAVGEAGGGRLTETGLSVGTPLYMSPEQASGYGDVGPATDLYALGCVLYEMLTGEPPFRGSSVQAILGRIMTGSLEAPAERRPAVPRHVDAVVRRALERLPADRFGSARELRRALDDPGFRWGEDGAASGTSAVFWRRAALAMALVATLTLAFSASLVIDSGGSEALPPLRHTSILPSPGEELAGGVQGAQISADGTRVVYRVSVDGAYELRTRLLSDPQAVPIAGTDGVGTSFFLSPGGEWVAFHHPSDSELKRVRITGGPVERLASIPSDEAAGGFLGGDWGRDGSIVYATRAGLHRIPAEGGTPERLTTTDPEGALRHGRPALLPDGTGVVYTVTGVAGYPPRQEIALLPFGGTEVVLTEGHSPWILGDDLLIYARGDTGELYAALLDDGDGGSLSLAGAPVRVMEGVYSGAGFNILASRYAVAEEGTLVYLPEDQGAGWELAWMDRTGGSAPILDHESPLLPPGSFAPHGIRLSPEGDRLAFTLIFEDEPRFRIFVYNMRRRTLVPLSVGANADWSVWTPDGESLVFNRFTEEAQDLHIADPDNTAPPEPLLTPNPYIQFAQDFSPDGRRLVFQRLPTPNARDRDIGWVSLEDGEETVFRGTSAVESRSDLSPDGRWLAYTSDESGHPAIYVADFPEHRNRVRVSVENAFDPVWSPTGDEIFYRRSEDGALMAVPVSTRDGFQAAAPELLFRGDFRTCCINGRSFDPSADGERFVMMPVVAGIPRLEVVQNWLPRVRQRLGR